jgi:hypothetical protein
VTAVIVLPTAGRYLIDVSYMNQTEQNCSRPDPSIEDLTTYLQVWDGTQYTTLATWTDPCTSGFHDHLAIASLQPGWNYVRLRIKHLPTQPGHAWLSGITFHTLFPSLPPKPVPSKPPQKGGL